MFDNLKLEAVKVLNLDTKANFKSNLKDSKGHLPLDFLELLTNYLKNNKEDTKSFSKEIRNSIQNLETHLDENYLLLFEVTLNKKKVFNLIPNLRFVSFSQDLVQILDYNGLSKEAELISKIGSKLTLGVERYFLQVDKIIKKFTPANLSYKVAENENLIEAYLYLDIKNKVEITKLAKETIKNDVDSRNILIAIQLLKKLNNKSWTTSLKSLEKYLIYFPTRIVRNVSSEEIRIEESLFPHLQKDVFDVNKKVRVEGLNNLEIANRIVKILE